MTSNNSNNPISFSQEKSAADIRRAQILAGPAQVIEVHPVHPGTEGSVEPDSGCRDAVASSDSGAIDRLYRAAIGISGSVPYQLNFASESYDFFGPGIEKITGYAPEELTPALWRTLVQEVKPRGDIADRPYRQALDEVRHGKIEWQADVRIRNRSGETRWLSDSAIPLSDESGVVWGCLGILQDVTDRRVEEEEARIRSIRDPLTGVANRTLVLTHLEQALYRAGRRRDYLFAIVFLGLDRFGIINESLGHAAGDAVLRTVASRLESVLRPGDIVARFSGDEFVLLLDDLREPDDVVKVIEKVKHQLSFLVRVGEHELALSASCGIVISSEHYQSAADMLRDAGTALRRAKAQGRGRYEFFDTGMHRSVVASLELEGDLRRALPEAELQLHYQPIIAAATRRITGFEALLRWKHPQRGWISPADFIPLAEDSDLIVPIGKWVLSEAARQIARWRGEHPSRETLSVSVNLSARQFVPGDLVSAAISAVREAGIAPEHLKLEITESVLMQNQHAVLRQLEELRREGFHLHLDDFGTGYSSLAYLHMFPISALKIDRSFVAGIGPQGREREIVRSILALGQTLNLEITAEGIEQEEQLSVLVDLGCTSAQGFFFSRPLPAEEAGRFLGEGAAGVSEHKEGGAA